MSKLLRYFLFSSLVLSVLFLASCEDDGEDPIGGDDAISLSVDGATIEGDTIIAAPGSEIEITLSLGTGSTDEISVVTNNGSVVNVPSTNTVVSGSAITVTVSAAAGLDDEATLTFSSGGINRQLTIDVGYMTVVDAATSSDDLSILVEALGTADLVETLSDENADYTVFAPTNQAFEDLLTVLGITQEDLLAREDLADILLYHVVDGSVASGELENGDIIETQHPDGLSVAVRIDDNTVMINGATVTTADIETGNGIVHVINQVLLPQTVIEYEAVLLAAPLGQASGTRTSETFFSSSTGETYSVDEVVGGNGVTSADIDFGYYYGATNEASLAAPSDYPAAVYNLGPNGANWSALNETMFRATNNLSIDDFNAISAADAARLVQEYEVATEDEVSEINNLSAGDLYAFRTVDNRYGILQVLEIVDGNDDGEFDGGADSIEIAVKVTQ
ncbi:fasciclin domain-containing protein [Catalinimonas niigatensis]|uniref:fasciclin domain-containing protein n=1 Tax=Catalinimonas niigatensis TaxID=1397264 RepID=UPI002666D52B|nr:fasciclin domain-containing protein [Catalinimonas niigatensis]WPP53452.1 fasciclin domain-containing protein [Catalinimonas niigatensis]